ncbi:MAG: radical SAM protein [Desulfobacterales bacterium]|nr:radical SAM protein [Desulfobacterales bacterium]
MKILLINPPREILQPACFPPMGLAYIGGVLRQKNHKVRIIDASSYSWKKLEKEILLSNPDIVGITCWTIERGQAFITAKIVRQCFPWTKIIIGGQHATAFPEHMFQIAHADIVVIGEGEETVLEIITAVENNNPISQVKGIVYKEGDKIGYTEPRGLIEDLDSIPFPAYDDFDLKEYTGLPETKSLAAAIITSRGCPYNCIYCSSAVFWKRAWRSRTAENVLEEIVWLYKDYNVRSLIFFDDLFFLDKNRAIEICKKIIEKNLDIRWVAEGRVNSVNQELLYWMKRAGCYRIDYGVESGSPRILKNINKKITVEQIRQAFKLTHEVGIKPDAYLMVGNPGETNETIDETIQLMGEIKPYFTNSGGISYILPNTELYEKAKQLGIVDDDYWLKSNDTIYYTGEHSLNELKTLKNKLTLGLARNKGTFKAHASGIFRVCYDSSPIIQKIFNTYIVKYKNLVNWVLEG